MTNNSNITEIKLLNGQTRWEVRWSQYTGEKRVEKSKRFATEPAAIKHKHKVEAEKDTTPVTGKDSKRTVAYWADRWLVAREAEVTRGKIRASTLHSNRQVVALTIKPLLGARRIKDMTVDDVEEWMDDIARTRSPGTVRHHYGVLSQVLAFAVRKRALNVNPAREARPQTEDVNEKPFEGIALTEPQVATLVTALEKRAPGTPWPLLVKFIAYTGLRAGEVAGLNIGDIRLVGGADGVPKRGWIDVHQIRVKGKGTTEFRTARPKKGKRRTVPILQPWLRAELQTFLAAHPNRDNPDAPLWPGQSAVRLHVPPRLRAHKQGVTTWVSEPDYGKPWDRDPFYKRHFKPALAAANLPPMRLHDLRHTAITNWLQAGVTDTKAATYAGHSVDVLRKTYLHFRELDAEPDFDLFKEHEFPAKQPIPTVTRLHTA